MEYHNWECLNKRKDILIERAFPELVDLKIKIKYKSMKSCLFQYYNENLHGGGIIKVDLMIGQAPITAIDGGLVHELSHIVSEIGRSKKKIIKDRTLYSSSKLYRRLDERNTDLEVVLRGFGNELLDYYVFREALGYKFKPSCGLSPAEIKKLI